MRGKNCQPRRLLYLARLSFRYERQIKAFPDKQKLMEFTSPRPGLRKMLKLALLAEAQKSKAHKILINMTVRIRISPFKNSTIVR